MTITSRTDGATAGSRGFYFFLSYAHTAPTSDGTRTDDVDVWVREFYYQLSHRVRELARPDPELDAGFFDDLLPAGSDWAAELTRALGLAEVFVPLYSPRYLSKAWPIREREAFQQRLSRGPAVSRGHVVPVLWVPLPPWEEWPEVDDALALGSDVPEYTDNGLRALCMLTSYREQYVRMLTRLAGKIVDAAERSPVGPSHVPAFDVTTTEPELRTETPFVVAVSAPARSALPPLRAAGAYGTTGTLWRPFGAEALPIAEYVATVAERLGLPTRIVDLGTGRFDSESGPGVLLIDPWTAASDDGAAMLRASISRLPKWVIPLVVIVADDPQFTERGAALGEQVVAMLAPGNVHRIHRIREVAELVALMPAIVVEARRQYLRNAVVFPPQGARSRRPRLAGQVRANLGEQENDND